MDGHFLPGDYPFIPIFPVKRLNYNEAMTSECDLNLLPLHRISGRDRTSLPGLMIAPRPRKTARGRELDNLFIYLALAGNAPIPLEDYASFLEKMGTGFYASPGSLTSALRQTAEQLNQALLNRNLATTGQGQYIIGRLVLGNLRGSQLMLVQSGPTHVFHVSSEGTNHIHDGNLSGRGLGFSQGTPTYFSQLELNPGQQLVLCAQLPDGWESALMEGRGLSTLETLQRKLLALPNDHHNAVLVQVVGGKGRLNLVTSAMLQVTHPEDEPGGKEAPASTNGPSLDVQALRDLEQQSSQPQPVDDQPASPISETGEIIAPPGQYQPTAPYDRMPGSNERSNPADPVAAGSISGQEQEQTSRVETHHGPSDRSARNQAGAQRRAKVMGGLLVGLQTSRKFLQSVSSGLQTLVRRMLPGENGPILQGSTMAFIAILVPLSVVVIASTVYMRYGRSAQYKEFYNLAVQEAMGTLNQPDGSIVKHAWESTLYYLDKAEQFQTTNDSAKLRQLAQDGLDSMEKIIRLDFRLAIFGGLSKSLQVDHMAATETDLYLLNSAQGNVLRFFMTSQGYEADTQFKCGPGSYGSIDQTDQGQINVGTLIDIQALPRVNLLGATLMGMDADGTLILCAANVDPKALKLEVPYTLWKKPAGFTLNSEDYSLYVLDPGGNAVWIYPFDKSSLTFESPELFFSGNTVPNNMDQAKDIAVDGSDLFLLFADGHVTSCTPGMGDVIPLRCNDPDLMTDSRAGHQSGATLADAHLVSMTFAAKPDPSLYMLEPDTGTIFRFSPRPETLYLQNLFRASAGQERSLFPGKVSAMAISPNRIIFLFTGSQVYFASDVP